MSRNCRCLGLSRAGWYAEPVDWMERDQDLIEVLSDFVEELPRCGFWKYVDVLVNRGYPWNHQHIYWIYYALGLNQSRWTKRKISGAGGCGDRVDTSLQAERLVRIIERLKAERGLPDMLRVDNGPEFLGQVFVN